MFLFIAGVDQREAFQEKHRKDARHQIEDQTAEKSEANDARERRE